MSLQKLFRSLFRAALVALTATSLAGCIKDKTDDCDWDDTFSLIVRAQADAQADVPLTDVVLYTFDDSGGFIKEYQTETGRYVTIDIPASGGLHIVGWGNACGSGQVRPVLAAGDGIAGARVCLAPDTRATACLSPDELFHGVLTLTRSDMTGGGEHVIPILKSVGQMNVAVRGLNAYFGFGDQDYRIEVSETCSAFDFAGNCTGPMACYRQWGAFSTVAGKEVYSVPNFNVVPGTSLTVSIFHGADPVPIYEAAQTSDGSAITVVAGRQTEVVISFLGEITVGIAINDWNSQGGGKEF